MLLRSKPPNTGGSPEGQQTVVGPHQLHGDGGAHPPGLLESPGEVEEPGPQRRLQHDEHGPEGAEPRGVSVGRGAGQQADALPGEFFHDLQPDRHLCLERSRGRGHPSAE